MRQVRRRLEGRAVRGRLRLVAALSVVLLTSGIAHGGTSGIPDDPVLSEAPILKLQSGSGDDQFGFTFTDLVVDPGWTNSAGDTISITAEITFGSRIVASALETLLVFTSIRSGTATVSCAALSPGGALPFSSFGFTPGSFGGDVSRVTTATDGQVAGESRICNAEDANAPFIGLVFDGTKGIYTFTFQIQQLLDDVEVDEFGLMRFMAQSYVAPEPSTGLLVLFGLAGLAARRWKP